MPLFENQYRLYLDESGDHSSVHDSLIEKRYLGLTGVSFAHGSHKVFRSALDTLKEDLCGDIDAFIHREDLVGRRNGFEFLNDDSQRHVFNDRLFTELRAAECSVVTIVIDKRTHGAKSYRRLRHPYHYCLHALIERYVEMLERADSIGDVMAESRGAEEDRSLKAAYASVYANGTRLCHRSRVRARLSSGDIKIKGKQSNIAGLQIADLFAYASTRDVLHVYRFHSKYDISRLKAFDREILKILQDKYHGLRLKAFAKPFINGNGRHILT